MSLVKATFCDTGLGEISIKLVCLLCVNHHLLPPSSLPVLVIHPAYIAFTLIIIQLICIDKFIIFNHNLIHIKCYIILSKPQQGFICHPILNILQNFVDLACFLCDWCFLKFFLIPFSCWI